ncbi:prolactin-like [Notolabrus celidotus]|uniref:prolactin-like n=1 Tax=Notolabrus celidotus TaxID=1203425 RepID=UPI0014905EFD|nr:prolactin-like [Notolabrus celidotus]XP_034542143.1 prolactin-like [Notolabrus celidotus]
MRKVWFAVLTLVYLELPMSVETAQICLHGQVGCHVPSLADLFDRVIQQSSRMHGISTDLHSEIEQFFFPSKNIIGKRKCHTHGILTPADKENAQRLGREQLTQVILRLLGAWDDPLSHLFQSMSQDKNQDFNHHSYNKALEISDMVHELRDGVEKMTEKMKLLGVLGDTVGYVSPEALVPSPAFSFYMQGKLNSMDYHDLLYCFHRDSNKIKNYLRVLKCTTFPGLDC